MQRQRQFRQMLSFAGKDFINCNGLQFGVGMAQDINISGRFQFPAHTGGYRVRRYQSAGDYVLPAIPFHSAAQIARHRWIQPPAAFDRYNHESPLVFADGNGNQAVNAGIATASFFAERATTVNAIIVGIVGGALVELLLYLVALVVGFSSVDDYTTLAFLIGWAGSAILIIKA